MLEKDGKTNEKIGYSNKDKIAKVPESSINALTTPLSLTGTPEEIDAGLLQALTEFTESHVRLQQTVDEAREKIAEAVKAVQERDKNKSKSKTSPPLATADKEEEKKPGSRELPLLWCKPAGNPAAARIRGRIPPSGTARHFDRAVAATSGSADCAARSASPS